MASIVDVPVMVVRGASGETSCSFRAAQDSSWEDFIVALEAAFAERLDDGHVLVHGTDVLGGRQGKGSTKDRCSFLATAEDAVVLTLVVRQRPQVQEAIDTIAALLACKDTADRGVCAKIQTALRTLRDCARKGDPQVIDSICTCLQHVGVRDGVRRDAVGALAKIAVKGDQRALDAVVPLLCHRDWEVRCAAECALAEIAEKEAVVPLLRNADGLVRTHAVGALAKVAVKGDQEAVCALIPLLRDGDGGVRCAAVGALVKIAVKGDQEVLTALIPLLRDGDLDVRSAAVGALGDLSFQGDQRALDALVTPMSDRVAEVRRAAERALAKLAEMEAVVPLLRDAQCIVRIHAVGALAGIAVKGDKVAFDALTPLLRDGHYLVQCAAVRALAAIADKGDQLAIAAMSPLLAEGNWYVRYCVKRALDAVQSNCSGHNARP